jgi:hypothetical protein
VATAKKRKEKKLKMFLEDEMLVVGTLQNLSNLYSLDIYVVDTLILNNYVLVPAIHQIDFFYQ